MEKAKVIEKCKLRIEELEEEKTKLVAELEKYVEIGKQKERQMFEQQLKIQIIENESENYVENGEGK